MLDFAIMQRRRFLFCFGLATGLACLLGPVGCGGGGEAAAQISEEEIRQLLDAYLPKLGEAYSNLDASLLEGLAVTKEIASVDRNIEVLAEQGQLLEPTLVEYTLEDVTFERATSAWVTSLEIWDLRTLSLGSREVLHLVPGQRSRVKYHLSQRDGSWLVFFRSRQESDLE